MKQDLKTQLLHENSTLGVRGRLTGSGTVVILDRKPVLLTSSHILQGLSDATVIFPEQIERQGHVIFDSPADDLAVIAFPEKFNEAQNRFLISRAAAEFCSKSVVMCVSLDGKSYDMPYRSSRQEPITHVDFIEDSKSRSVQLLAPWEPSPSLDVFIGNYDMVLALPIFLRPGASGGAFYCQNGNFCGLVTKVSSSGEPLAFAIPLDAIEHVLWAQLSRGNWVKSESGRYQLRVQEGDETLEMGLRPAGLVSAGGETTNGGGETTNGGGETTNGGGETTNGGDSADAAPFWQMQIQQLEMQVEGDHFSSKKALRYIETMNPFRVQTSELTINGRRVADLEISNGQKPSTFVSASWASYVWHRRHEPQKLNVHFEATSQGGSGEDPYEVLRRRRAENPQPLRFGRLYARSATTFSLMNRNCDTLLGDGAEALLPADDQTPVLVRKSGNVFLPTDSDCLQFKAKKRMKDGFFNGSPFMSRSTPGTRVDTKFESPEGSVEIVVANDLSSVTIIKQNQTFVLRPTAATSATSQQFASETDKNLRAVAAFDTDHLEQLDRLFIKFPSSLVELQSCRPGKDCFR